MARCLGQRFCKLVLPAAPDVASFADMSHTSRDQTMIPRNQTVMFAHAVSHRKGPAKHRPGLPERLCETHSVSV